MLYSSFLTKMLRFVCVLLLATGQGFGDSVTDGTTLVQTFMIHRHGDRTPVEDTLALTTDPVAVEAASEQYGFGQLTDVGIERAYKLGQFIRARYNSLLSPNYNKSEIYIRSTDSTRTKMTVLTAMAAVFPAYEGSWSREINWVPVPYTTVPVKYDFNLANINCPVYSAAYYAAMFGSYAEMDQYADVLEVLAEVSGTSLITSYPAITYGFYDAYVSQESLGIPLSAEVAAVMPRLKMAAGDAMNFIFGDEDNVNLMAGVLLNEFFTYATTIINGTDTPPVRVYSAHDINVFSFMAAAQITPRQGVPGYASLFALELRRIDATGKYGVLPVYKPEPNQNLIYLRIAGCDSLPCDLDQFKQLVSKYLLDEDTWRTDCGWTKDLVINDSSVA